VLVVYARNIIFHGNKFRGNKYPFILFVLFTQIVRQLKSMRVSFKIFPWQFGLHAASTGGQPLPRKYVFFFVNIFLTG
jgi:hypothetical protein